jgi:hypothetical protein
MICRSCGLEKLSKFVGELVIHLPGLKNLDKPTVWVFPEIWVCLNCGDAEFAVPERELFVLALVNGAATDSITTSPAPSAINWTIQRKLNDSSSVSRETELHAATVIENCRKERAG